ncbi:KAP family NTPase [Aliarcobacter butzleri]|uniref:P-loop NTPase fold protein n=1 Tax=Aliarcobacter butzleri TaxID=28197 RepID=UPI001EDC863C|nr:P-loop NTPase fold protein [Aliarcobacter butzleri]MCG3651943.1 KAP family NTPase [Aliarcobacter butzleri]
MFLKNILKFTSILTILFLITYFLFPIIKWIVNFIDSNSFIVWIILIAIIIYYLCIYNKSSDKITLKKNKLFDDETDKEFNADKVVGLKNIINSHEGNRFFSLALIGDWGSGKSSFLRKLEDIINSEKKDVVIYLNVWELENIQNILQEIEKEFDDIILKFSKEEWIIYHLKGILVRNYFSLLSKYFVENGINISLSFSNTIKDSKDEYNKLLKRVLQDKKIVLILDELDRLEAKEDVQNIFKVIRYLTSFDKVFTITGLDINKLPKGIELDYTHKIFNSKYVIPKTTRSELLTFLGEKSSEQLSDFIEKEKFNEILNTNIGRINLCLIDFITNYREAKSILNDTYMICNSLNKIPKWNQFISFEFILVLNIIKSVNLEFYLKFMNEEEKIKLLIMKYEEIRAQDKVNLSTRMTTTGSSIEKDDQIKIDKFLEYGNVFYIFNNLNYKATNLNQNLYIYTHQNIYDYMFTEDEYKDFLKDTSKITNKIFELNKLEVKNKYIKNEKQKDNFILFLINSLYQEENKENRLKVIETIFKDENIEYSLQILTNLIESYYTLNVMEELFKFNLNNLDKFDDIESKNIINSFIVKVISRDKTNTLIKLLFNNVKGTIYGRSFKDDLLRLKYISEDKDKLIELHDIIKDNLEEDYNTFFEDEEQYIFYVDRLDSSFINNSFDESKLSGKEIKKMIKKNIELENKGEK